MSKPIDATRRDPGMSEDAIQQIRKRNGTLTAFDPEKIRNAVYRAHASTEKPDHELAGRVCDRVIERIKEDLNARHEHPTVEAIQDIVESTLIDMKLSAIAKAYIVYRLERRKIREEKMSILNTAELDPVAKDFDVDCLRVLASRYLMRNNKNEITESPTRMFERVALLVGLGDMLYDQSLFEKNGGCQQDSGEAREYMSKLDSFDNKFSLGRYYLNKYHFRALINHYVTLASAGQMKVGFKDLLTMLAGHKLDSYEERVSAYFDLMASQDFLPNSPTMMNAGGRLGQLSACFVLDMPDNMEGIMKSTSDAALIFKSGGGVGINYSDLRQEGDIVASTSGVASGPVSFMNIINTVTEVVKQGGKRRGANMGILEVWHPDVEKFILNKTNAGVLENFNVSVGMWEDFWRALVDDKNGKYMLRGSRDRAPVKETNAHQLFDLIALSAWKSAEPGLIFFDQINKYNVFAKARGGPLRATNPCGEQSLYPYESCNLGSINLANLVKRQGSDKYEFDWQRYEQIIRQTTRFLDNIIDVNHYPVGEIDRASKESRRIGLGVMGVADLLYKLKIPYNSKEGYELQSALAEALTYYSMEESVELAKSRGQFGLCPRTEYPEGKIPVAGYYETDAAESAYEWDALIDKVRRYGIRNVLTTTVAPTGTLSMIAGCSNGMEPTFALVYEKRVTVGRFFYTNKAFEKALRDSGLYSEELLKKIAENYGSIQGLEEIPEWMRRVFVTAMDIHWADHLYAQSVWQQWIGNAIAKTINMPYDVTVEDVKAAYLLAHEMGLKGITVYRDGSRHAQVLHMTSSQATKTFDVVPTPHVTGFVTARIGDPYIRSQVDNALRLKAPPEVVAPEPPVAEAERETCPSCSANLVFAEGCHLCIECGHSGCTSG